MRIIYDQGDIVLNRNNFRCAIVLEDYGDNVSVLETDDDIVVSYVPKRALDYKGHVNFKRNIKDMISLVSKEKFNERSISRTFF